MNTRTLHSKSLFCTFINEIEEILFNLVVFILKPIVRFVYKKYRLFKNSSKQKKAVALRTIIISAIICILGITIAFGTGLFVKNVNAHEDDILHKYYTSITIEPGDSLWSIAQTHYTLGYDTPSDYIEEVMHINHIKDGDEIMSGSTLVIPYYSEEIK